MTTSTINIILAAVVGGAITKMFTGAASAVGNLTVTLGGLAAASAGIRSSFKYVADLDKLSKRTGKTIENLVVMQRAFRKPPSGKRISARMVLPPPSNACAKSSAALVRTAARSATFSSASASAPKPSKTPPETLATPRPRACAL